MKNNKKAVTTVEIMIGAVILSLMLLFVVPILSYSRKANSTMQRLDSYHDIRRVDQEIASEMKFGSAVMYPPRPDSTDDSVAASDWYSQVIFRNAMNQVMVLFVNESDQLVMLNYDELRGASLAAARTLANRIKGFAVRRHGNSVVEYRLAFDAEGREFAVTNKISMLNVF